MEIQITQITPQLNDTKGDIVLLQQLLERGDSLIFVYCSTREGLHSSGVCSVLHSFTGCNITTEHMDSVADNEGDCEK